MDSQDIVIWGKVRPDMFRNEIVRIRELCEWGKQFKLDGFVRYRVKLHFSRTFRSRGPPLRMEMDL